VHVLVDALHTLAVPFEETVVVAPMAYQLYVAGILGISKLTLLLDYILVLMRPTFWVVCWSSEVQVRRGMTEWRVAQLSIAGSEKRAKGIVEGFFLQTLATRAFFPLALSPRTFGDTPP